MSNVALRGNPQLITILETEELIGTGKDGDPFRNIKRYWVLNKDGHYNEWFRCDTCEETSNEIYEQAFNRPF